MFSFVDYTYEIFKVSETMGVDVGIAYDMLRTDIRFGERANTGNVDLAPFDIAKAHAEFMALTEEEQKAAYGEWHDFLRRCYDAAVAAYPDREKMDVLIHAYHAGEFDPAPETDETGEPEAEA